MLLSQFLPERREADERAFLAEAVAYYCANRCPLVTGAGTCRMLTWRESAHHMGALEKVCTRPPLDR